MAHSHFLSRGREQASLGRRFVHRLQGPVSFRGTHHHVSGSCILGYHEVGRCDERLVSMILSSEGMIAQGGQGWNVWGAEYRVDSRGLLAFANRVA
jgi:hypothetical protein